MESDIGRVNPAVPVFALRSADSASRPNIRDGKLEAVYRLQRRRRGAYNHFMATQKVRVELRKNRSKPPRENDITRSYHEDAAQAEDAHTTERVRAKGAISRYRTIVQDGDGAVQPAGDAEAIRGRVIRVHGLASVVEADDGRIFRCAVRRLLKSLATDERSAVTTGDIVWFRESQGESEGLIERVEPRRGVLTRSSRRREHIIVANVDQLVIVMSLVEPD